MGFILSIIVGGIIGWLASIVMRANAEHHIIRDILIGSVGALFGGFFLGPVLGGGNLLEASLDIRTLMVAVLGALGLLAIVIMFRRRRAG